MYEAVRQRAPNSSQLVGVTVTALAVSGAIYALMNGLGQQIADAIEKTTVLIVAPPATPPDPPPPDDQKLDVTTDKLEPVVPDWVPPDFVIEDDKAIIATSERKTTDDTGAVFSHTPPAPASTMPRMRTAEKPSYPGISLRAKEEGTTDLRVCVDSLGRVTSATVAQSSGSTRLDDAALKWVRGVHFTPGTVGGAPQAVCGHKVSYEWHIEETRG